MGREDAEGAAYRRDGGTWDDGAMAAAKSHEKEFRRLFRAALSDEVTPALGEIGFECEDGGCSLRWNDAFTLAPNIGESKWNKFGAEQFQVLFSIWMIEEPDRWVRGIWLPIPQQWRFDTRDEMETVGGRLLKGILHSAVPLAEERWGVPQSAEAASVAAQTTLAVARQTGEWHIPGGES